MWENHPKVVDRRSKVPLYHQLKDWIIGQIERGELDPGTRIPSEMALFASLGMSRTTVREALNQLVAEGWLYRIRGIGTFVRDYQVQPCVAQCLTSFAEDVQEQHSPYYSQLLLGEILPACLSVAASLQLVPGTEVIHLERLGSTQGEPLVLADTYLPRDLCRDLIDRDLTNCSLFDTLKDAYGLVVGKARRTLQPTLATPYEAEHLHISPGDPVHPVKSISYLPSERPVEHSRLRFRGDRSRFVFTLNSVELQPAVA